MNQSELAVQKLKKNLDIAQIVKSIRKYKVLFQCIIPRSIIRLSSRNKQADIANIKLKKEITENEEARIFEEDLDEVIQMNNTFGEQFRHNLFDRD